MTVSTLVRRDIRKLKLGKNPVTTDNRTLKLARIINYAALPPIPTTYDVDDQFTAPKYVIMNDPNMFMNDIYGDCVMAYRAHHTLRLEDFEQFIQIPITDNDVKTQYFLETGGKDTGLNMLASLNLWRQKGWSAAGQIYKIHAFASVDFKNHKEVMTAIFLFNGLCSGLQVPNSAMDQFSKKQPWVVVADDGGIDGGHAVYTVAFKDIVGYNEIGPVVVTWGQKQQVTWAFWDKYFDEVYAIIDERDSWLPPATNPLNIPLLEQYLAEIGSTPSQQMTITTLSIPKATVKKPYTAALEVAGGVPPYTWSISSGALPPGMAFTSNGVISGTTTTKGSYKCTYMVSDTAGNGTGVILTLVVKNNCIFG